MILDVFFTLQFDNRKKGQEIGVRKLNPKCQDPFVVSIGVF